METRRLAYVDHQYLRTLESESTQPESVESGGQVYELAVDGAEAAVRIVHIRVGNIGQMRFGHPEVYSMLDWATAYKSYLEDSASTHRSLARFAWNISTEEVPRQGEDGFDALHVEPGDQPRPARGFGVHRRR